jgi:6-phosphogluconate dehydrogenase
VADIAEVWRRGSVISFWLLDLGAAALAKDPQLKGFSGFRRGSLDHRGRDRGSGSGGRACGGVVRALPLVAGMLSAMRLGFGGHIEGEEPIDAESEPKESEGRSATHHAAE